MNLSTKMVTVLTSVGLLSGSFLASVGLLTKARIALNKQKEIENAIIEVIPGTRNSLKVYEDQSINLTIYKGLDEKGIILGYAIYTSGTGFQDIISIMFGTNKTFTKINSLAVLEQKETPGLGAKITDWHSFLQYWENKDCKSILHLRKPAVSSPADLSSGEINTITGATISSEAVLNTVNSSLKEIMKLKKEGKIKFEDDNAS